MDPQVIQDRGRKSQSGRHQSKSLIVSLASDSKGSNDPIKRLAQIKEDEGDRSLSKMMVSEECSSKMNS